MNQRLFFACFILAVSYIPDEACAQFTAPRAYDNIPVGTNQLELSYAYVHADASIDTSLIITGANFNLDQGTIDYTRYFGLLDRLMWVEATVPVAGLSGSVTGTNIQGSTTGAGDSSYQLAMLVKGGPALTVAQFESRKPTTSLGVSFAITAPTGSYHSDKILNLGSHRWSFKPEIALTHPFGPEQKWEFDAYANISFYTDNTSYRGRGILRQQPLPGVEGHISYSFNDSVWASLDTRYSFRGTTFLNGVSQNNAQQNFILGSEMNISLNPRNSLVFEFAKALVHENGPALVGFSVKYDFTWGKVYRRDTN
jgi:Putative MetA-pathway of phenol degradation